MLSETPSKRCKASHADGALRGRASRGVNGSSARGDDLLTALLHVHCELGDELLGFLDPHAIAKLSTTLRFNKRLNSVLEDRRRWRRLLKLHCGVQQNITSATCRQAACDQALDCEDGELVIMVKRTIPTFGCQALANYVSLRSQLLHLRQNVLVVEGDLGTIKSVGDNQVDCLVFLTSGCFRNPGVGVAGRVHERAGSQLDASIERQRIERSFLQCGQVLSTPGFQAGVSLLVHCVGPPGNLPNRDALLCQTYRNALLAIHDNTVVKCAAIASISTGRLQFPVESAAEIAMRAVRDLVLERDFDAKLVFVCFEKPVLRAFERAKRNLLTAMDGARFVTPT